MSCSKCGRSRVSRLRVGSGQLSPPAFALFAAAPDAIVRADAAAAAVLAVAPLAVMRADARAPAVLAAAPLAVMLADARAPAVLAAAPLAVMLADARARAYIHMPHAPRSPPPPQRASLLFQ